MQVSETSIKVLQDHYHTDKTHQITAFITTGVANNINSIYYCCDIFLQINLTMLKETFLPINMGNKTSKTSKEYTVWIDLAIPCQTGLETFTYGIQINMSDILKDNTDVGIYNRKQKKKIGLTFAK